MSALHRRHDVRISDPVAGRPRGAGRRIQLEFRSAQGFVSEYAHSPIGFHDPSQIAGTPFFDEDRFIIKFNNFWTIEAPPGYSILFTHPVNRGDLPFTTFTGLVDCDTFHDSPVNFPAHWHDTAFNGVLPKGTPVAQCLPVKRESWTSQFEMFSAEDNRANDQDARCDRTGDRRVPPAFPGAEALIPMAAESRRVARPAAKIGRAPPPPAR